MKGLRSTVALLVVLLGLGGYIYFQGATPTDDATKQEKVFPGLLSTTVEELKVKSEAGDVTTLKKTDGVWSIVSPMSRPASDTDVTAITNVLTDIDIVRVVDENPTDLKEFGLDAPQIEVEYKAESGKKSGKLLIGVKTATGGNLYALRDNDKKVLLVPQYHEAVLNKSTFDLRDKRIVKLDRAKVEGVELTVGGKVGEFAKSGDDWKMSKPVAARADNSAIDGLFASLDGVLMKSVVSTNPSADDLKKYGLDKPLASVALRSGTERLSFMVGGSADDASVYVRDGAKPDVYTIESAAASDFKKAVEDYRRRELFDARAFSATHVEFTRNGQTIVIERVKATEEGKPDTWKRLSPNPGEPDRSKVESLLAGLADIRATAFQASNAGTGLATPVLTVYAKYDEGKKEERVSFGQAGSSAFGARPDDPGAAKIEAEKLTESLKALDEIAK